MKTAYKIGLAALALTAASGCMATPSKTEVGVKYCKWLCGDDKVEILPSGSTKFFFPLKYDVYKLDKQMQNFYMTYDPNTGDRPGHDDLVFKTIEGNNIGQDAVVTWRLDPTKAELIVREVGTDMREIKEKFVRPVARSVTRDAFNELRSKQFYEAQDRFKAAKRATARLQKEFAPYGILIDQVNPQDFRFVDNNYQTAINDAKIAQQTLERADLQRAAEEQLWIGKLETQKGISNETIAKAQGEKQRTIHSSDAYYVEQKNAADAIISEAKAEAAAVKKKRQAMASRGGLTAVQMMYVEHFNPKKITVLPCDKSGNAITVGRLDLNDVIGVTDGAQR